MGGVREVSWSLWVNRDLGGMRQWPGPLGCVRLRLVGVLGGDLSSTCDIRLMRERYRIKGQVVSPCKRERAERRDLRDMGVTAVSCG